MKRRPVIGITAYQYRDTMGYYTRVFANYSRSVSEAGGLPFILPPLTDIALAGEYLDRIDGLLLTGGDDICPLHYGEQPLPEVQRMNPERDAWELALAGGALERDMALFGICRGHQLINVACGGSLHQHVNGQGVTDRGHMLLGTEMHHLTHPVLIGEGTLLSECFAEKKILVNSFHNQAVKETGKGLTVTARSEDGLAEALEMPGKRYVLGVQWHPEALTEKHPCFLRLFEKFVNACDSR